MFVGWCGVFVGGDRVSEWHVLVVLVEVGIDGGCDWRDLDGWKYEGIVAYVGVGLGVGRRCIVLVGCGWLVLIWVSWIGVFGRGCEGCVLYGTRLWGYVFSEVGSVG